MSFGDRLREAAQWIAAHPDETITVTICGRPSAFINDDGRCTRPACREAKA